MLYYTIDELIEKVGNRYTLVSLISKRSRQIVHECTEQGLSQVNPVSEAVENLMNDDLSWNQENGSATAIL